MKKQRSDTRETRRRLLATASEVFAKKGYWEASHADICDKAKVNTAAVNYHFGSKDNLYVEAWKYAFERSIRAHPPDGGVSSEAPAEERLRARILSLIWRAADPQSYDIDIIQKEMANPTGLLTRTIPKAMIPIEQGFRLIVQELLGSRASEQQLHLCQMSIMTQCLDPMLRLRLAKTALKASPGGMPFSIEELVDHVSRFSLSGIRGIREQSDNERVHSGEKESGKHPRDG